MFLTQAARMRMQIFVYALGALLMTMSSRVPKIRVKTLQALEAWVRMKVGQT